MSGLEKFVLVVTYSEGDSFTVTDVLDLDWTGNKLVATCEGGVEHDRDWETNFSNPDIILLI